MPNSPADDERLDSDPTDELPILLETAVLDPEEHRGGFVVGDEATGEHTILTTHDAEHVEELKNDLEQRGAKIAALEQDISRLSARWTDVERHLTAKDTLIDELNATVGNLRTALDGRIAAEHRSTVEIADRESQIARLAEQVEQAKRDLSEREGELAEHKRERKRTLDEIARLKRELAAASREPVEVQSLREEVATLTAYIANRRTSWDELDAKSSAQAERITELEREVAHRAERQQRADAATERERARAESAREQLVAQSRRTETLDVELKNLQTDLQAVRAASTTLETQVADAKAAFADAQKQLASTRQALADRVAAQTADAERYKAELAAADVRRVTELAAAADAATRAVESAAAVPQASLDAIAELKADLEQKRSELAAERTAAREQTDRLAAELDSAHRQLAATRAQVDQARTDAARLEHAVIDKDQALRARDEQVATLQKALDQKLGALQKLNAMDLSLQGLDSKMSERLRRTDAPALLDQVNIPALVCLTGDGPRQYSLNKKTMTIGRSSRCDIQLLTQFVSREHARLTIAPGAVVVEDLGSTNGIFVNAVRVDRQELRHGDLVTVGETQFRFLESMAH
jgi:chromosome segregation ATPase